MIGLEPGDSLKIIVNCSILLAMKNKYCTKTISKITFCQGRKTGEKILAKKKLREKLMMPSPGANLSRIRLKDHKKKFQVKTLFVIQLSGVRKYLFFRNCRLYNGKVTVGCRPTMAVRRPLIGRYKIWGVDLTYYPLTACDVDGCKSRYCK